MLWGIGYHHGALHGAMHEVLAHISAPAPFCPRKKNTPHIAEERGNTGRYTSRDLARYGGVCCSAHENGSLARRGCRERWDCFNTACRQRRSGTSDDYNCEYAAAKSKAVVTYNLHRKAFLGRSAMLGCKVQQRKDIVCA